MKPIFIFKWKCRNGFVFIEMHPNLNVQRAGNRVTFAIWNKPHETIFHFKFFYRRCERIFCKWFCFVTLSKLCSYKKKTLFPFLLFSSWQRRGSFVTVVVMRRILSNYWQGIIITFSRFLRNISKLVVIPL